METRSMGQYIEDAEKALLHTYNRYQIVLDKGEGVYLYDMEGKKYLDFCAGIAVFALGYHNERYNNALKAQISIQGTEGKVIEEKRDLGVIFGPNHFIKLYYGANGIEILKAVIRLEEETANPFG